MGDIISRFTTFDKLIATSLIKILYWIGIAVIVIGTLFAMFAGFSNGFASGLGSLIAAPIGGVIGLIVWRFLCEIYIVLFGMYDRLGNIEKSLAKE
jgi:hypothetical protein